jgi:tRNA (cmo5U34)-methyltransferase
MDQLAAEGKPVFEKMDEFFTFRLDNYEEHMLKDGGDEVYRKFGELVPANSHKILDLGCGTGLELDEVFRRLPGVAVVGIDLTPAMLEKLKQKHPNRNLELICGNYFDYDPGEKTCDVVISFQTLHHFPKSQKLALYRKIYQALTPAGVYLESDYMLTEQAVEDRLFAENARWRREWSIPEGEFYHFDTPCTIDNQIGLLRQSGFKSVELRFRKNNTMIISALR